MKSRLVVAPGRIASGAWLCALMATLSCGDETAAPDGADEPPEPASLQLVAGSGQTGVRGRLLAEPLVVRVVSRDGTPVSEVDVTWEVLTGNGSVVPNRNLTDADGRASAHWRLGSGTASQLLHARIRKLPDEPVVFTAQAEEAATEANFDKIDPPLLQSIQRSGSHDVIALGSRQLLLGPGAFEAFAAANAGRPRSVLRDEVTAELKALAEGQRDSLLAALGNPEGARHWWIMNAVFASIGGEQVKRASMSDAVARLYLADQPPAREGRGTVASVLPPVTREPFSAGDKEVPWNLERIGAPRVWRELDVAGEGVTVALIDNGTDYLHPDLRRNVWINRGEAPNNGVDDDGNGLVDDYYGFNVPGGTPAVRIPGNAHGTYTAGIVAGDGTGGIVTGVAPRAQLQLLVLGRTLNHATTLQYALENGADVATMSFSIPDLENLRALWRLMADHAAAAGLVQVSGAGNFRQTAQVPDQLRMPEAIPGVVAVGGVDRELRVVARSSMGPVDWSGVHFYEDFPNLTKPDVAAFPGPGYPMLAPFNGGYVDPNTGIGGNSFSGPHAAGVAALVLSANPELPAWEVKEILESTAEDLSPAGKDNDTGWGLLNAFPAVQEAFRR